MMIFISPTFRQFLLKIWPIILVFCGISIYRVSAQLLDTMAATGVMNELSAQQSTSMIGIDRARDAVGLAQDRYDSMDSTLDEGEYDPQTGAPIVGSRSSSSGSRSSLAGSGDEDEDKIVVIVGRRVFDAVTKVLIDDPVLKKVKSSERRNYYDDGTHGDMHAGDGVYTLVDDEPQNDVLDLYSQRSKEKLIQALLTAESYEPTVFFGYEILSMEDEDALTKRDTAWGVRKDPDGIGYVVSEEPVDKPVKLESYKSKLAERDNIIKNNWTVSALQPYRRDKDSLSSEFYPLYIPKPPQAPSVEPPSGWRPFNDPGVLAREQQNKVQQFQEKLTNRFGGSGGGGGMGGGAAPMAGAR